MDGVVGEPMLNGDPEAQQGGIPEIMFCRILLDYVRSTILLYTTYQI